MADKVNLQRSYSKLNESLVKLFDESGVRRTFTVPYLEGQPMDEHIQSVAQAAGESGGLTNNLLMSAHHSEGKGWGSGDGHTVAHPSEKLRTTTIRAKDEDAKAAVEAAQTHLNGLKKLLGDDNPTIQTAQSQLNLVKPSEGAGMNLLDFGVLLTQIMYKPHQEVSRAHSGSKEGGHAPHLRAPGGAGAPEGQELQQPNAQIGQEGGSQPQGATQAADQGPEGQNTVLSPAGASGGQQTA